MSSERVPAGGVQPGPATDATLTVPGVAAGAGIAADAPLVLVTGVTGYVATHCAYLLWQLGYRVRGTVRSAASDKTAQVRALADSIGVPTHGFEVAECPDLREAGGWDAAAAGCDFCLHVASPFPSVSVIDPEELVAPACEGVRHVLEACFKAGVKRVVQTSSVVAMDGGAEDQLEFNEHSWGNEERAGPYPLSKIRAEKLAWELHRAHVAAGGDTELATVQPSAVNGPALTSTWHTSGEIVRKILSGEMAMLPEIGLGVVDARDVARVHVAAMTHPAAANKRYIASESTRTIRDYGFAINSELQHDGIIVSTSRAPDCLLRCAACCDPQLARMLPRLNQAYVFDRSSTDAILPGPWFPWDVAVGTLARGLIELGMVDDPSPGRTVVAAAVTPPRPPMRLGGLETAAECASRLAGPSDTAGAGDDKGKYGAMEFIDQAAGAYGASAAIASAPYAPGAGPVVSL